MKVECNQFADLEVTGGLDKGSLREVVRGKSRGWR